MSASQLVLNGRSAGLLRPERATRPLRVKPVAVATSFTAPRESVLRRLGRAFAQARLDWATGGAGLTID